MDGRDGRAAPFAGRTISGTDQGIALFEKGEWRTLTTADGLAHNAVLSMAVDPDTRDVWAGSPLAESVELVYMDGAFVVPIPPGGAAPAEERRVAVPLSRLGWVVRGRVRGGPPQMIGLLDLHTGRVAWNIRPLPVVSA